MPTRHRVDAQDLMERLRASSHSSPFDKGTCDALHSVARKLRQPARARAFPQLAALAFWLRPAEIQRLREAWNSLETEGSLSLSLLVPRGVVFHVPPSNVDTLFVYSWALSALVGNANVVRIPAVTSEATTALLEAVRECLDEHPHLADSTALVTYGHEADISAALSEADVRVVWGGDDTVLSLRSIPRPARSVELSFPDRTSLAVLNAARVVSLEPEALDDLVHRFFNDAFWFDQLACSSPRLVVWQGSPEDTRRAREAFYTALKTRVGRQGLEPSASAAIAKMVHAADTAAAGLLDHLDWRSNAVTVAELRKPAFPRDGPGGGLFYDLRVDELDDLQPVVDGRDQTLSYFGVEPAELWAFARALNGRGIDRIVPVGKALSFDRYWDGLDLLQAFSKRVAIVGEPRS